MKQKLTVLLVLVLSILVLAASAMARDEEGREMKQSKPDSTRMHSRLIRSLNLDEATAAKVAPILDEFARKRQEMGRSMGDAMQALRDALEEDDAKEMNKRIAEVRKLKASSDALSAEEFSTLQKHLSIRQQAQFLLILEREIHSRRPLEQGGQDRPEMRRPPMHNDGDDDGNGNGEDEDEDEDGEEEGDDSMRKRPRDDKPRRDWKYAPRKAD